MSCTCFGLRAEYAGLPAKSVITIRDEEKFRGLVKATKIFRSGSVFEPSKLKMAGLKTNLPYNIDHFARSLFNRSVISVRAFWSARPRWLTPFFSSSDIWEKRLSLGG